MSRRPVRFAGCALQSKLAALLRPVVGQIAELSGRQALWQPTLERGFDDDGSEEGEWQKQPQASFAALFTAGQVFEIDRA